MYIDENIILRDDLPEPLKEDFAELQGYYDEGNWLLFDIVFEVVQARVKAFYISGHISLDDVKLIFERYGLTYEW